MRKEKRSERLASLLTPPAQYICNRVFRYMLQICLSGMGAFR